MPCRPCSSSLAARLRRSRAKIEDLAAYLHTAVRREALRIVRRRPEISSAFSLVASKNGMAPEEVDCINQALGRLPGEQCEVVLLHVYEEMTFRRIGEILGVPADTAASRYRYARKKLQEWLRDD